MKVYVITSEMKDIYCSIAEMIESAIDPYEKCIFIVIRGGFENDQIKDLMETSELVRNMSKGVYLCHFADTDEEIMRVINTAKIMPTQKRIGASFEYEGELYEVVKAPSKHTCSGCAFEEYESCHLGIEDCYYKYRMDGIGVIFKKVKEESSNRKINLIIG